MNVFDFDGTIYDGDSSLDFWIFCLKKNPFLLRYFPSQLGGAILFKLKRISKEDFKSRFFCFFAGISDIDSFVKEFWSKNERKIKSWYLKMQKDDDLVISASPDFLLSEICNHLGIKNLLATKVDKRSCELLTKNCHGANKVVFFRERFGDVQLNSFYTDSKSDEPMAKIANHAFLVKGEKIYKWEL